MTHDNRTPDQKRLDLGSDCEFVLEDIAFALFVGATAFVFHQHTVQSLFHNLDDVFDKIPLFCY